MVQGRLQCSFNGTADSNTISKRLSTHPDIFSPLSDGPAHSPAFKETIGSPVIALLFRSFPSAVARPIAKGVVNSSKCQTFWPQAQLLQENLKIQPSGMNRDPSAAIAYIVLVLGIR